VTQNVDGLSVRANQEIGEKYPIDPAVQDPVLPQPTLIEMHGRLFDVLCSKKRCKHRVFNTTSPICEALAGTEELVEHGTNDPEIGLKALPRCSKCGSLARPGVVWFGEMPHHMGLINDLVAKADLCLVIGTSSTVRLLFPII
jgi:NAD-dependent deacetylase sirtuin 5